MSSKIKKGKKPSSTVAQQPAKKIKRVRDYKREYEQYHGKAEQRKNRSNRNKARRKLGLKVGDSREVDHVKPISKGGGNGKRNLRAVSRKANRVKWNH